MKTQELEAIARAMFQSYVDKDRATAERLVAKDFHFSSPLDNRIDRTSYFKRCWPNSKTTAAMDLKHVVVHGKQVFVTYEGVSTQGERFRNTELLTIQDGQLTEVEVYFGWSIPHKAAPGGFVDEIVEK